MPLDRTHQHISTSIMRDGDPQTPIDPDGGGGLTNPLTEALDAGGERIINLGAPGDNMDAARLADMTLENVLTIGNDANAEQIKNLADPTDPQDAMTVAATLSAIDEAVGQIVVFKDTIDLTAGQIATLNSVPVQVVAAPGAGKVIVPVAATIQYKPGVAAFDALAAVRLMLGAQVLLKTDDVAFDGLDGQVLGFGAGDPAISGWGVLTADGANVALMAKANEEPDGAGDGTARLTVLYYVMDLLV